MLAGLPALWPLALGLVHAEALQDELVREGEHFRLVCHDFSNEAVADQSLEAVEAVWPRAAELYALDDDLALLSVHLYRDANGYAEAEQELTRGAFRRNLAFSHFETMSAHVALQPRLSDEALAEVGLPGQTLRLLAHEAAHLVRYPHNPNYRSHPDWLADGSAAWIDERVRKDLGLYEELEQDPYLATSILTVQRLLEEDRLPTSAEILTDDLGALGFSELYDVRWLYFRFLIEGKHEQKFRQVLTRARQLGGGADFTRRLFDEAVSILGKKMLASIDRGFSKYVAAFEPAWEEVFRTLQCSDERWLQAAFDKNAVAWRRADAGKKYTLAGELTLLPGAREQMNLFLGRSEKGFLSVAFSGGGVNLFEYLSETEDWQARGHAECPDVRRDAPFSFSVTVAGKKVRVEVNGKLVIAGEAQTLSLTGPWGLSAQANAAGIWKLKRAPGL
jgi:hypothetical protein